MGMEGCKPKKLVGSKESISRLFCIVNEHNLNPRSKEWSKKGISLISNFLRYDIISDFVNKNVECKRVLSSSKDPRKQCRIIISVYFRKRSNKRFHC